MTAVWSASGTSAGGFDGAFTSNPWTITSATLGAGDIYFILFEEGAVTFTLSLPSVVIDGVTATQVGSSILSSADRMSVWKATVTHATGNIVVTPPGAWVTVAANWGLISGNGAPTLTSVNTTGSTTQGPVTGTIGASGVGVCTIGGTFGNASNPSTWAGATRIAAMEGGEATGNQSGVSGATVTAAGAASVTVTNAGWNFSNNLMVMLAFPASGGAVVDSTPGISKSIFIPARGPSRGLSSIRAFAPVVPSVSGTLATTEATDTAAFTGNSGSSVQVGMSQGFLFHPGAGPMWELRRRGAFAPDIVSAASGTFALTEGTDAAAFAGALDDEGSFAVTEATDAAAFAGAFSDQGSFAVTDGTDTAAIAGGFAVNGSFILTDAPDGAAFSGDYIVSGSFAVSEGTDIALFAGGDVTGTLASTEGPDVATLVASFIGAQSTTVGGTRGHGRDSYDRKEIDRLYDEWKHSKNKKIKKAVEEAVEVLAVVAAKGLLAQLEPAIELKEAIEALPAKPTLEAIAEIREQTAFLERLMDEEDEDDIMLMVWALN